MKRVTDMARETTEDRATRWHRAGLAALAGGTLLAAAALLAGCASQPARESVLSPRTAPGGNGSAQRSVSLAGTWQLDLRATGRSGYDRGAQMPAGRTGFPGGGGGGYPGRPGAYPRDDPERMRRDSLPRDSLARDSVMREMGRLVIEQTDSALTFTMGKSASLTVYADWRETRIPGRYGPSDVTFVTGAWRGARFEVRRALPSRTVLIESYEVSNDGAQLTVTTRVAQKSDERGEILPREGRRIYNRAPAEQAPGGSLQ
jgi:hypothetical protein